MALGADRGTAITMILRNVMSPVGAGPLIGIPVALGGGHVIANQLFGVKDYDPIILLAAVFVLLRDSCRNLSSPTCGLD